MKFQCDRCKTRYSIADERVRGKILKIRCKNCEAVITVREGMDAASAKQKAAKKPVKKAPVVESKPVLRNAFERVMDSSAEEFADSDNTVISDGPPQQLEEEWYVSLDGEQFGPFNRQQATDWVAVRPESDELFCWSEGFGDWLPIEKVSHFRRLRSEPKPKAPLPRPASQAPPIPMAAAASPSSGRSVIPSSETTPKPLFAATLERLEKEENPPLDQLAKERGGTNGRSQSTGNDATDEDGEFEFDIGEASRVVKLPMIARTLQAPSSDSAPNHLPGMNTGAADAAIGHGTGGHAAVGKMSGGLPVVVPVSQEMPSQPHEVLTPSKRGWISQHLPLVIGLGALAVVVVVMATIAMSDDDDASGRVNRARANVDGLGESLDPRTIKIIETREVPAKGTTRRGGGGTRRGGGAVASNGTSNSTNPFGKRDDMDLTTKDDDRPLDGDDLMSVYRDNRLAVKLCYERALKKDPLLDVRKVYVNLTVSSSGVVTKVLLSSHQDTQLGTCLVQRMRRWRFRKSSETFSGRFPLVFRN